MFLKTDREIWVCKVERSPSVQAAQAALSLIAWLLGKGIRLTTSIEQDMSGLFDNEWSSNYD